MAFNESQKAVTQEKNPCSCPALSNMILASHMWLFKFNLKFPMPRLH